MEGRDWTCDFCKKSYLKMESLVHHIKLKHSSQRGADKIISTLRFNARLAKRKKGEKEGDEDQDGEEESEEEKEEQESSESVQDEREEEKETD